MMTSKLLRRALQHSIKHIRKFKLSYSLASMAAICIVTAIVSAGSGNSVVALLPGVDDGTKKQKMQQHLSSAEAQSLRAEANKSTKNGDDSSSNNQSQGVAQTPTPKQASTTGPKYAISSDPRSTAYSSTPPAPNPASFEIKITKNGQVAAGTQIMYNATKHEKAFYGGDLVLSKPMLTISKNSPAFRNEFDPNTKIMVNSPDGRIVNMPTEPWDDNSPFFWIGQSGSSYVPTGSSFTTYVNVAQDVPVGTHQLHYWTTRSEQAGDAWYYDAFLTVVVTE